MPAQCRTSAGPVPERSARAGVGFPEAASTRSGGGLRFVFYIGGIILKDYKSMSQEEALSEIIKEYSEYADAAKKMLEDGGDVVHFLSVLDSSY